MEVATELWHYLKPYSGFEFPKYYEGRNPYSKAYKLGAGGVSVPKLRNGLDTYAMKRGIKFEYERIKAISSSDGQAANFIKASLCRNMPVLLLSLKNGIDKFQFHWVMITEIVCQKPPHKEDEVTISTWGGDRRTRIDFDELWNCGGLLENQYLIAINN